MNNEVKYFVIKVKGVYPPIDFKELETLVEKYNVKLSDCKMEFPYSLFMGTVYLTYLPEEKYFEEGDLATIGEDTSIDIDYLEKEHELSTEIKSIHIDENNNKVLTMNDYNQIYLIGF